MLLAEELKPSTQTTQGAEDREEEWSYVEGDVFWGEVSKGIQKKQGENTEAIGDDVSFFHGKMYKRITILIFSA